MRYSTSKLAELVDAVLVQQPDGLTYDQIATDCGMTLPQAKRAVRHLCKSDAVNYAVPTRGNGWRVVRETKPDEATFRGMSSQARHLTTRIATQQHRMTVAALTTPKRGERKFLHASAKVLAAAELSVEAHGEMLDSLADLRSGV